MIRPDRSVSILSSSLDEVTHYQHTDLTLSAELNFHPEGGLWVLTYFRGGERTAICIYPSRSTAELLLNSLGYFEVSSQISGAS